MTIASNLKAIQSSLANKVTLVAVSKTKPNTAVLGFVLETATKVTLFAKLLCIAFKLLAIVISLVGK